MLRHIGLAVLFVMSCTFGALANPKIVVLGDSLSAGYGLPPGASFPEKLQAALDGKAEIIGAGVSGDTSAGGLSRLEWSVPEDAAGVLIALGSNDALRGISPDATKANIEAMVEKARARGQKVLLAAMRAPPNMGADYAQAFDGIFEAIGTEKSVETTPFFLDGVAAQPDLNLPDGIHPNERGIDVMVERLLPHVERFAASLE